MGTKGAHVTEVCDAGVKVAGGCDEVKPRVLLLKCLHHLSHYGVGMRGAVIGRPCQGGETQGKFPASKVPTPPFQERLEEGTQCLQRAHSAASDTLGTLPALISHPPNHLTRQILIISVL